jgi:hypothetical protein
MYAEEVPIYTNQSITQRRKDSVCKRGIYIYQSINYTEDVRQCIQKRYLYIYQSINYTEEVGECMQKRYLYIPIYQLHRGGKTMHTEGISIYSSQSITQRK